MGDFDSALTSLHFVIDVVFLIIICIDIKLFLSHGRHFTISSPREGIGDGFYPPFTQKHGPLLKERQIRLEF